MLSKVLTHTTNIQDKACIQEHANHMWEEVLYMALLHNTDIPDLDGREVRAFQNIGQALLL